MMREQQLAYHESKHPPKTEAILASQIVTHWQTRHLYGKALIITDHPFNIAKLIRRRWLSAMQRLQQERSQTVDADQLLSLTHSITRMQQMVIAANAPHEFPAAHLWCIAPGQLETTELPRTCRTTYVCLALNNLHKPLLQELIPTHTLVVDFGANAWDFPSKDILDDRVHQAWQELLVFFSKQNININKLLEESHNIDSIDDAIDSLLDVSSTFLRHARHFQEALHFAQPLQLSFREQKEYDIANMLARRVTMLTPGLLHHSFIQTENDTFSLYDRSPQKYSRESLTVTVSRHVAAGRHNLARALQTAFVNNRLVF